jgi:C-terminal processing protease CtpA/Prc
MILFVGSKRMLFPDGHEFEGIGIQPDIEVPPDTSLLGEDLPLSKAIEILNTCAI